VGSLPLIRGQWYYVDPTSGADTSDGRTIGTALAGLAEAYDRASDGDGIALLSYGATSAATTSYLYQELAWSKNGITVFGVEAPVGMFGRARVANKSITSTVAMTAVADTSLTRATGSFLDDGWVVGMKFITNVNAAALTVATVTDTVITITSGTLTVGAHTSVTSVIPTLMTLSGANNRFFNVHFYNGGSNALDIGGVVVSGLRNYFQNCHFVGGAGAATTANNYSLQLNAAEECYFVGCAVGSNTFAQGNNAAGDIILTGVLKRNHFIDCEVLAMVSAGTAHGAVKSISTSGGTGTVFKSCLFNYGLSTPTPAAFDIVSGGVGNVTLVNCANLIRTWFET